MNYKEEKISSEYIFKGKILNLKVDTVKLPNGKPAKREIIEHNGGSAVLCVVNDKILLVKQFRTAFNEELWEIPAGLINKGESPLDTAFRELEEESGFKAKKMTELFSVYPSCGYTEETIHIFMAEDVYKGTRNLDEDEFLNCCFLDKEKVFRMLDNGEIKDAKTVIALLYLKTQGKTKK